MVKIRTLRKIRPSRESPVAEIDPNCIRTFSHYEYLRDSNPPEYIKGNYTFEAPHMLRAFERIYQARKRGRLPIMPPIMRTKNRR